LERFTSRVSREGTKFDEAVTYGRFILEKLRDLCIGEIEHRGAKAQERPDRRSIG
jgi:hypothetical protein